MRITFMTFNNDITVALKNERDKKRSITDIDSSQFLTSSYDPTYAWSIWMQQKKAEVKTKNIKSMQSLTLYLLAFISFTFHKDCSLNSVYFLISFTIQCSYH